MDEQQLIDRYAQHDELLAQMIPLLREIWDCRTDDLTEVVDLLKHRYEIDHDVFALAYPYDGTRLAITAGTTIYNFEQGTVMAPGASVADMSGSLSKRKKEYMRSLMVDTNRDVILQIDDEDKVLVRAGSRPLFVFKQFTKLRITTTANTEIIISASTSPEGILQSADGDAVGQTPFAYESKTVDATSGGVALTSGTYDDAVRAEATLETAQIRYRFDGTNPTSSEGHLVEVGDVLVLKSAAQIAAIKLIRTGGTSGVVKVTYFR